MHNSWTVLSHARKVREHFLTKYLGKVVQQDDLKTLAAELQELNEDISGPFGFHVEIHRDQNNLVDEVIVTVKQ